MSIPVSTLTGANTINQMMYNVNTIKDLAANSASAITGPGSSTDNAVVRWDGTNGLSTQNSGVTIADDSSMIISGSSSGDMLRITQTGAGNALLVEDSANPDSTPFVVDATGTLVSGATSSYVYAGSAVPPRIQVQSVGGGDSTITATSWATGVNTQARLMLARSEGGVVGTHTVVDSGDNLGQISFQGSDGTSFVEAATISVFADGAASASDMPGRLVFGTTADGASSPTERMRITSSGNVGIGVSVPDFLLDVAGRIGILEGTNGIAFHDGAGSVSAGVRADSGDNLIFATGSSDTERMRINSSGNVGIGRTPTTNLLEVAGTIESTTGGFKFPDGSTQTSAASAGVSTGKAIAMAIVFG